MVSGCKADKDSDRDYAFQNRVSAHRAKVAKRDEAFRSSAEHTEDSVPVRLPHRHAIDAKGETLS